MARDIEEFLRRAAERRQQQKAGNKPKPAQRPAQEAEIVQPEIVRTQMPSQRRADVAKPKVKTPRPTKQRDMRHESVADHVKSHLDTSRIAEHAENLGDRIASVHDQVDQEIHQPADCSGAIEYALEAFFDSSGDSHARNPRPTQMGR
jgi:hypothetical protein